MPQEKLPSIEFHFLKPARLNQRVKLRKFIFSIFKQEKTAFAGLVFIFCSDPYLLKINQEFLGHDDFTDILSFNLAEKSGPVQGEIYISIDRVRENAANLGFRFENELFRVIFHGVLHLCGYRDKTSSQKAEMRKAENRLLRSFAKQV